MHFPVYVIIGQEGDIEWQVDQALEPYCEDRNVAPYKDYLRDSEFQSMARSLNIAATNLQALADSKPDWRGTKGGVDDVGLFAWSTVNPSGRWDWYVIGGRWDGHIQDKPTRVDPYDNSRREENTLPVSALLRLRDAQLRDRLPDAILTADALWHD